MKDLVNVEGIPVRRAEQGHHLGLGDLPRIHGRRRGAQAVAQPGLHRAADAVPPLRHGRGLDGARGDAGGNGEDRQADRRGRRCRRAGLLLDDAQPAYGLRGQAAGLPQRQPRGDEGLRQPAEEARQGRHRDRAHPPGRRARGRPVRAARLPADRERPAGDLHRPVRSRRHSRGGARHAAPRRADDRQGRAAADLAAAAHPRSRHEQSVLLRRLPGVEAGVRRHRRRRRRRRSMPIPPSATSSATTSRTRRASATGAASASMRSRIRR